MFKASYFRTTIAKAAQVQAGSSRPRGITRPRWAQPFLDTPARSRWPKYVAPHFGPSDWRPDALVAGPARMTNEDWHSKPLLNSSAKRSRVVGRGCLISTSRVPPWSPSRPQCCRRPSGSLVPACVASLRHFPQKSAEGLPGSSSVDGGASLGRKLLRLAAASIRVPSTPSARPTAAPPHRPPTRPRRTGPGPRRAPAAVARSW